MYDYDTPNSEATITSDSYRIVCIPIGQRLSFKISHFHGRSTFADNVHHSRGGSRAVAEMPRGSREMSGVYEGIIGRTSTHGKQRFRIAT